ncbi:AraC family transcriptional regulator [Paenibacillus sp. FSL W7-1287]|uniref:AraC family transcriptional regulator n=1 Tax=Paenibacillus sp. FSL W7-1287 TaxID=2954538 RepID=UPI0030FA858B
MSEKLEYIAIHTSFDPQVDEILFAGQSQTDPLHYMGPLIHSHYIVHYVISGKGSATMRGVTYQLSEGDSFFIFPDESVRYQADQDEPWRYCWVGFRGSRFKPMLQACRITAEQPIIRSIPFTEVSEYFEQIRQQLAVSSLPAALQASAHLQLLLARYSEEREQQLPMRSRKSPAQLAIDEVVAYIDFNYPLPLTITELAERAGYHRSHLSKLFRQIHGMSPLAYLIKVRLEQAQLLLAQQIPVHQAAQAVGFHDALYFSKLFKRQVGMTPSQYQAAHR